MTEKNRITPEENQEWIEEETVKLNRAIGETGRLFDRWFQNHGMNSYFIQTLYTLYREPELTQREISENYQIPKQTVNHTVKFLEKEGYLVLVPSEEDKRRKDLRFSSAGLAYAEKILEPLIALDRKLAQTMGREEFSKLVELSAKYADLLKEECFASPNNRRRKGTEKNKKDES